MAENEDNQKQDGPKDEKQRLRLLKTDHNEYTFVDIVEQIVILIGFLSFLVGFWYAVVRIVIMFFK